VASSLSLTDAELHSAAGQALVKDAIRAASRIDVGERFRVRLSRRAWLPLVPAALAFLLMTLVNPPAATSSLDPNTPAAVAKQINTAAESVRKKLAEQRKQAEREGLKAAEGLFKQIEAGTRELAEKKNLDRTKAAVKLNDLAKQLEQRRRQLGGKDSLQKQLQNLKGLGSGTAGKIAQAMKQGDFDEAAKEVEKLARELRDGQLDADAKTDLAKQLDAMKDRLAAATDAHDEAMDNLQQQLEQQRQDGDLTKAGELQQKLDELAAQMPQMDKLRQLANQLGKSQDGLQKGDGQQSADAMKQMAQQLGEMQQEANEKKMLDAALDQLQGAKDAMLCKNCQGAGCEACQTSVGTNSMENVSKQNDKPGPGIGTGRGNGRPAENVPATSTREIQVRQQPGRGNAVFAGTVEGPNIKGAVEATIQQQMTSFGKSPADPLSTDELPRNRREHAEEYFNLLREGK
jgi:RNA polymerase-interacting CarD/CdnL/TRCF family regulator